MVGGKDDDRVVKLTQFLQHGQHATDLVVDQRAQRVVTIRGAGVVVPIQVLPDALDAAVDGRPIGQWIVETDRPRQHSRIVALEIAARGDVRIVRRLAAEKQRPRPVGVTNSVAQKVDALRVQLIFRRLFHRLIGHTVEQEILVAWLSNHAAHVCVIPFHQPLQLVVRLDLVVVEAEVLQPVAALDVPLAEVAGLVACLVQQFWPHSQPGLQLRPVGRHRVGDVHHAVAVGQQAGEQAGPAGRADGVSSVATGEARAARRQRVEIRRQAGTGRIDRSSLLLVGDDEEEVGHGHALLASSLVLVLLLVLESCPERGRVGVRVRVRVGEVMLVPASAARRYRGSARAADETGP